VLTIDYGKWRKEWAKFVFATECTEFVEKTKEKISEFSVGSVAKIIRQAHEIRHSQIML